MIQLNLTLLVQIANFLVTFWVLKMFLFAPFIEQILRHKKEEKQLNDEIVLKHQDVENFLTEKTTQLSQFQKDATTDFPFNPATKPAPTVPTQPESVADIDQKAAEQLEKDLAQRISRGL